MAADNFCLGVLIPLWCALMGFIFGCVIWIIYGRPKVKKFPEEIWRDCKKHLEHAKKKHPIPPPVLLDVNSYDSIEELLGRARLRLAKQRDGTGDDLYFDVVLDCEIAELKQAISEFDFSAAYEECLDSVAVLLRMAEELLKQKKRKEIKCRN